MGLISEDDLVQMRADLLAVIGDRQEEISLRRGDETLAMQTVRVARSGGGGRERESDGGQEARGSVIVVGDVDFDVQPGDRFTDEIGVLYRVTFVRPNRDAAVTAEAEAVE